MAKMHRGSILIRALSAGVVAVLAASSAFAVAWIKDAENGCATSNPFPGPNESIRWLGNCRDGKLDGRGTLTWYRNGVETERNEGSFKDGELDGFASTRSAEGYIVYGQYKQGLRHGQFMTVRSNGEHIKATYADGQLVSQAKLTPQEIVEWNRAGGPQLIAKAPPPAEAPSAAAGDDEGPITGRTAVASPSRQLSGPPKAAAATGTEKPLGRAGAVKPSGTFTFGTQVADVLGTSEPPPSAPPAPAPVATAPKPSLPSIAAPPVPSPAPAPRAPAAPRFELGTQVADAIAQPTTLSASAPNAPTLPAPNISVPAYAPPRAASPSPAAAPPPQASPAPPPAAMTAAQVASLPVARPVGAAPAPQAAPPIAAPPIAAPQPTAPAAAVSAMPPGPVGIAPPGPTVSSAAAGKRPPWMASGAAEPVPLSNAAIPGATPPALPPSALASAAAPLAGPAMPYVPQPYVPQYPAQAYLQPLPPPSSGVSAGGQNVAVDMSPTAASRQYLAAREQALEIAETQPMQALLSYRAMQSGSYYPPPVAPPPGAAPAQTAALPAPGFPSAAPATSGSPETLFNQGYKLEMSGRFREAEQTYEQIILSYSATQTAMLANERLNGLRRNTRDMGVKIAERESRVVSINEPRNLPRHNQAPQVASAGDAGAGDVKGSIVPNLTGLAVCSQSGLYESNARWCGQVLADDGVRLSVEVRDIVLPGFGSIGIGSSKCTGGQTLNWFSKGSVVRVPRSCMELKG